MKNSIDISKTDCNGSTSQQMRDLSYQQDDLLVTLNQTPYPHQTQKCVHELFQDQVALTPDAIAVEANGKTLSYQQLNIRSNRLARFLQKRGVQPNTFVGIALERSIEAIISVYAVLKAGGAYVPLDPVYPKDRLTYMTQTAKIKVLLTQDKLAPLFDDLLSIDVTRIDSDWPIISNEDCSNLEAIAKPGDLIYLIFTSGSTGRPKGAAVYHRGFLNLINWFVTEFSIDDSDSILLLSSLSFDLTQKNLYATLISGGRLCLPPAGPYNPREISKIIQSQWITLINCTPSAFYSILESLPDTSFDILKSLRIVFLGGEPISIPRLKPWLTRPLCLAEIANTYGPTECTDICAAYRMTRDNMDQYEFVPVGRPIHNVQLAIVDTNFNICNVGESGELCVAGAGIGAGYINDKEMTKTKFLSNPFPEINGPSIYRTGDQARLLPDGQIEFLGRLDHQIKIRGFRVELHEIESLLKVHPKVREAIVTIQGSAGDENAYLVCHVMPHQKTAINIDEVKDYLKRQLPDYMIPSLFHFRDSMPLSPNGKVDRIALQNEKENNQPALESKFTSSPSSQIERQLMSIWSEIVGHSHIKIDDNFFDIGGNSLTAITLLGQIQTKFKREITIQHIYENPRLNDLCRVMLQLKEIKEQAEVAFKDENIFEGIHPISNTQLIYWLIKFFMRRDTGNVCEIYNLDGKFDFNKFKVALNEVAQYHGSLWCPISAKNPVFHLSGSKQCSVEFIDLSEVTEDKEEFCLDDLILEVLHKPFDLSQVPLFRMTVVKKEERDKHLLLVSFPHIVSDLASSKAFVHEVFDIYEPSENNGKSTGRLPKTSIREITSYEKEYLESKIFQNDKKFWKEKLEGTDRLRFKRNFYLPKGKPTGRKPVMKIKIKKTLLEELQRLSVRHNVSIQVIIFSTIQATLHTLSGQDDFSTAMALDIRGLYAYPPVIHLNTKGIAVRSIFSNNIRYIDLISNTRAYLLEAMNHVKLPGSIILAIPVISALKPQPWLYRIFKMMSSVVQWYYKKGKINKEIIISQLLYIWGMVTLSFKVRKKDKDCFLSTNITFNVLPSFYENKLLWSNNELSVSNFRDRELTIGPHIFKERNKYQDASILNIDLVRDKHDEACLYLWGGRFNQHAFTCMKSVFLKHLDLLLEDPAQIIYR